MACAAPAGVSGVCGRCKPAYGRAWCVGERSGALQKLIDAYKFSNARAASKVLAGLLDDILPVLPPDTVVVPVPTVSSHIRQRGYDHTELICRELAGRRRLSLGRHLERRGKARQRGASRAERERQAREAFSCHAELPGDRPYLLVDDIVTTGATMKYAATALREAGAKEVWAAAVARQTLD